MFVRYDDSLYVLTEGFRDRMTTYLMDQGYSEVRYEFVDTYLARTYEGTLEMGYILVKENEKKHLHFESTTL